MCTDYVLNIKRYFDTSVFEITRVRCYYDRRFVVTKFTCRFQSCSYLVQCVKMSGMVKSMKIM